MTTPVTPGLKYEADILRRYTLTGHWIFVEDVEVESLIISFVTGLGFLSPPN